MEMKARVSAGGPLLAAAGVLVAAAAVAVEGRMDQEWGIGVFIAINVPVSIALLSAGIVAGMGDGRPSGSATALIVSGLAIALTAIAEVATLPSDDGATTIAVAALAFCGVAAFTAWKTSSPVASLIAAGAFAVAFGAAVEGLIGIEDVDAFRWIALTLALIFAAAAYRMDRVDPHRAVQLVNAAGLAVLALLYTLSSAPYFFGVFVGPFSEGGGLVEASPLGWEIAGLLGCAALIAFAVIRREPGPGYLGALSTLFFLTTAAAPTEERSLVGWPLILIGLAVVVTLLALSRPAGSRAPTDQASPDAD